jgi:hypothetical protein
MRPSAYGVRITSIVPTTDKRRGQDFRVYWYGEITGTGNALMREGVNTEKVLVGETCDVIRNGNGRILMLRRPEPEVALEPKRKFEVEVLVELELPGDEDAAFKAVDVLMQSAWDRTQGGETIGGPRWHFSMLEGCVDDVTEEPFDV